MKESEASAPSEHTVPGKHRLRVLITGANGMIGHALRAAAAARNIDAVPIQRPVRSGAKQQAPASPDTILWEPEAAQPFADLDRLEGFDAVVHLAGANLSAHRWTASYKKTILDSRTNPTSALALALARLQQPPKAFISASAIGYYGSRGDTVLTEEAAPGTGFLTDVCQEWESAASPARIAGMRVVHMRFGVVLTPFGGALKQMLPLFRLGLGGKLGSGQAWLSWVTLDDVLAALLFAVEHEGLQGPVNVVSPNPVRNAEFTKALGTALHRPAALPVPAFALKLAFGQLADEALLSSCRAIPAKLEASGFQFRDPEIARALGRMLQGL